MMRFRSLRALRRSTRAVSAVEFALALPLFIAVIGSGMEITWLILTHMKVQRLANMSADLVARNGASENPLSEVQIYDIMSAMDVAAAPLDVRGNGRLIISAVLGEDSNNDGQPDVNRIKWQRFDGGLTAAPRVIGCVGSSTVAASIGRQLRLAEPLFHAQVSYSYQPFFTGEMMRWFDIPTTITRTASYRGRGAIYHPVLSVEGFPAKSNCTSANGL
ncbi:pilus assembly protein [Altererythrobacter xixiisoli]|uniref:Pilus assembly protein n=2 Tax=Croceibacterium xixiisoli TaxID=1476466 RepID=A0A6I4TTH2_9SPHN|nr:TadE/TadG family type IV pilus assembly protein [Croceibacterium xixiisoli]MXO97653.1 pilus assembly protein [Croceibacterium xixiisoli]